MGVLRGRREISQWMPREVFRVKLVVVFHSAQSLMMVDWESVETLGVVGQ